MGTEALAEAGRAVPVAGRSAGSRGWGTEALAGSAGVATGAAPSEAPGIRWAKPLEPGPLGAEPGWPKDGWPGWPAKPPELGPAGSELGWPKDDWPDCPPKALEPGPPGAEPPKPPELGPLGVEPGVPGWPNGGWPGCPPNAPDPGSAGCPKEG
jgi:hypothetical protein